MICHRYKCIFIEVPKTGSSSIRAIIGDTPEPHLDIVQVRSKLRHYWTRHGGVLNHVLAGAWLLLPRATRAEAGEKIFNRYFKFGFVRNPWDRVVSLYLRKEGRQLRNVMSFEEFVDWIRYSSSTCIHPSPHVNQLDWLVDGSGEVLVDYIGRFETLDQDWGVIRAKLGIDAQLPHVRRNEQKTKHYTEWYSEHTRRVVAEKFRTDIERFGYVFGG